MRTLLYEAWWMIVPLFRLSYHAYRAFVYTEFSFLSDNPDNLRDRCRQGETILL